MIKFSEPMEPLTNWTLIEEGKVVMFDKIKPVLELELLTGEMSSDADLSFEWTVYNFTTSSL